jgi:glyoxylase-like metal-dependent hydrolase (beta-lactamase superfamily II)
MSALRSETNKLLRQGFEALKSGDMPRARALLEQLVRLDEQSEKGWVYLALAADTEAKAQECLERVLAINPKNDRAREALARLRVKQLERIEQLSKEEVRLQTQIAVLQTQREEEEQCLNQLHSDRGHLETQITEHQASVATLRHEINNLQEQTFQLRDEHTQYEAVRTEHERLTKELDTLRVMEQQLDLLQSKHKQLEALIVGREEQADELQNLLRPLEAEVQEHQQVITDLRQEADSLRDRIRQGKATLAELEAARAEHVELTTHLDDLQLRVTSEDHRLNELQIKRGQREKDLSDLEDRIERVADGLAQLQAKKHQPLWQAILRTDLDAGELTPHADLILDRLGKACSDETTAFRLEIAARTGCVDLPTHSGEELSSFPRLFAAVIQARAAENGGDLTEAVQTLCDGWEALLPVEPTPEPGLLSPVRPSAPPPSPVTPDHTSPAPSDLVIFTPSELVSIARPTGSVQTARSNSNEQAPIVEPIVKSTHFVKVTGQWSTLALEIDDVQILVDPGPVYSVPDNPPHLVVVTHAHNDHMNQLLPLCERFPGLPVVMTPETCELLGLSLNGWTVIRERQVYCLQMQEPQRIEGIDILLYPAGHLLGAAMVDLDVDGTHILVTGDFSLRSVGGLPPVELPQGRYDLVLMEAVHASDHDFPSSDPRRNRDDHLIQRVLCAIEEECTRILIDATAMGDAQEVYDALLEGQRDPHSSALADYTICLKGMAHGVARLYAQAGIWGHAVPDECPDLPTKQTIVIASEGAAAKVREQFTLQRTIVFEPFKSAASSLSSDRERHYRVDLHAGLEELIYLGEHIQCNIIGLYHGHTSGSLLEKQLRSAGKHVVNVSAADSMRIGLDEG